MKPDAAAEGLKGEEGEVGGVQVNRADAWWVVSAFDVFSEVMRGVYSWPTVLHPAFVAQRVEEGRSGTHSQTSPAGETPGSGEKLCALAFPIAQSAEVRAVHWYRGASGTVIAETACGPQSSVVLVGWAPYDAGVAGVPGAPGVSGAPGVQDAPEDVSPMDCGRSGEAGTLPAALLLGIFDTRTVALRLAELVAESTAPADTVVVGRWSLPEGCPPMPVRSVIHPESGVLRRELVAQMSEAFFRLQARGRVRCDESGRSDQLVRTDQQDRTDDRIEEQEAPR